MSSHFSVFLYFHLKTYDMYFTIQVLILNSIKHCLLCSEDTCVKHTEFFGPIIVLTVSGYIQGVSVDVGMHG